MAKCQHFFTAKLINLNFSSLYAVIMECKPCDNEVIFVDETLVPKLMKYYKDHHKSEDMLNDIFGKNIIDLDMSDIYQIGCKVFVDKETVDITGEISENFIVIDFDSNDKVFILTEMTKYFMEFYDARR